MFFLGLSFLGGSSSVELTPTGVGELNQVEVTHAQYNDVYISNNPELTTNDLTGRWDIYTELYGKYDVNIHAGNIEYVTKTIDTILLKRRKKGDFKWVTIMVKQAESVEDLVGISGYDYTAGAKQMYEYAVVPTYNQIENVYYIDEVYSDFDGIHIAEKSIIYGTPIGSSCDVTRNAPSAVVELLNNKYPKYTSNTIANYDTGTATGQFLDMDCIDGNGCALDYESSWKMRNQLLAFLTNRKPKILKFETGAIWLVNITGYPTDQNSEDHITELRTISFEWTETGDYEDETTLYYAGISDVPSIWWNG